MDQPKFHIDIFWSEEDGGYIANVPDLRFCSAFGESYEEALREVLVAMELHLEALSEMGRPVPEAVARRAAPTLENFEGAAQKSYQEAFPKRSLVPSVFLKSFLETLSTPHFAAGARGVSLDRVLGMARSQRRLMKMVTYARPITANATTAARRKAKELGVDLSRVEGTGPGGRITERDVLRATATR